MKLKGNDTQPSVSFYTPRKFDTETERGFICLERIRKKETLEKGWEKHPEWLLYNEKGSIIDVANLQKPVFYKCLEKAESWRSWLHGLRHTCDTLRSQAGHNIAGAGRQLWDNSIRITVVTDYYWMPESNSSEADELNGKNARIRTLVWKTNKKGAAENR